MCQERGTWKGMQIQSERLKTHTSSTPSMFREVTHTHVETSDSQETLSPLQVRSNSAQEEALRPEELTSLLPGSRDTQSVIKSDQGPHTPVQPLEPTFTHPHQRTADSLVSRCLRSHCQSHPPISSKKTYHTHPGLTC